MDKKMIDKGMIDKLMAMLLFGKKEEKEHAKEELKKLGILQEESSSMIELKKEEAILRFLKEGVFWEKKVDEDLELVNIIVDGKVLKGEAKHVLLSLSNRNKTGWYYLTGENIPEKEKDTWLVPYKGRRKIIKKGVTLYEKEYIKNEEQIIGEMERIFSKIQQQKKERKKIIHKGFSDSFTATFSPVVDCFSKKFLNVPGDEERRNWYESEGIQITMEVNYVVEIEFAPWVCQGAREIIKSILEKRGILKVSYA